MRIVYPVGQKPEHCPPAATQSSVSVSLALEPQVLARTSIGKAVTIIWARVTAQVYAKSGRESAICNGVYVGTRCANASSASASEVASEAFRLYARAAPRFTGDAL